MIYHLLPELEPFSAHQGGALAHTVASLMKIDRLRAVVCIDHDESWGLPEERIIRLSGLQIYYHLRARQYYPEWLNGPLLRRVYAPLLQMVKTGDIVWCHNRPQTCLALQDKLRNLGVKLVYHAHDAWSAVRVPHIIRKLKPDAWIFVSDALRQQWTDRIPTLSNTYVVHNGANEHLFYPAARKGNISRPPLVLFVGRLQPEKGVHILIDAIRELNKRHVACRCRIVGSSFSGGSAQTPYERSLKRNAPNNVEFAGHRSAKEVSEEFRAADVLCCPSSWQEPFGKVNIEAMACGLPVVASRVGGIPEIASKGGILLVDPDSFRQLADALERLLISPNLRAKVAEAGLISFTSRFKWSSILAQYRLICSSF